MSNIRKILNNGKKVELPIWNGRTPYALYYNGECVWKNGEMTGTFITVWKITTANKNFTFPICEKTSHIGIINWGDGKSEKYDSSVEIKHNYKQVGEYTITIDCEVMEFIESAFRLREDLIFFHCETANIYNDRCFSKCTNLETLEISDEVEILPPFFCYYASLRKKFIFPKKIKEIRFGAFWGSELSGDIKINASIVYNYAFMECKNISSIEFDDNVEEFKIAEEFKIETADGVSLYSQSLILGKCNGIKQIIIGNNNAKLKNIPPEFHSCEYMTTSPYAGIINLQSVKIAEGVEKIGEFKIGPVFYIGANKITECEAYLPSTLRSIGCSFKIENSNSEHPSHILTIHYNGTLEQWNNVEKYKDMIVNDGALDYNHILKTTDGEFRIDTGGNIV